MSWISRLIETYDAVVDTASKDPNMPLAKMGFIPFNGVSIEIELDENGELIQISPLEKESLIAPCTYLSGLARTNNVEPHPLFDSVKNIYSEEYLDLITSWCKEPDVPDCVKLIQTYVEKNKLTAEDVAANINIIRDSVLAVIDAPRPLRAMTRNEINGLLPSVRDKMRPLFETPEMLSKDERKKLKNLLDKADKSCIRWRVRELNPQITSAVWERQDVYDSWEKYFPKTFPAKEKSLCYATGKMLFPTEKSPFVSGTAILVPLSKQNNFEHCIGTLFQGEPSMALSLGYESIVKAMNTFKWLSNKQGNKSSMGKLLAWDTITAECSDFTNLDPFTGEITAPNTTDAVSTVDVRDGIMLAKASAGYYWKKYFDGLFGSLENNQSKLVIMMVDTPMAKGNASVVYYQELDPLEYMINLRDWYDNCRWFFYKNGKLVVKTPTPTAIGHLLYGIDANAQKIRTSLIRSLVPCIVNKKPLPYSLITQVFTKCKNPYSFKKDGRFDEAGWESAISILCALLNRKNCYEGGNDLMLLDTTETDRSYLFGRLLAVANFVEKFATEQQGGKSNRDTNAIRVTSQFCFAPEKTWQQLKTLKLLPYFNKISSAKIRDMFRDYINDIETTFTDDELGRVNGPLSPMMMVGYSVETKFWRDWKTMYDAEKAAKKHNMEVK